VDSAIIDRAGLVATVEQTADAIVITGTDGDEPRQEAGPSRGRAFDHCAPTWVHPKEAASRYIGFGASGASVSAGRAEPTDCRRFCK
jgi:hypothetical protein